jgi:6-phosphogluconolactonase
MRTRDARGQADVQRFDTTHALMDAAAEEFVRCAATAMRSSGRFAVALSGGSTPAPLYALLATSSYAARVEWARVHVFWSDERCVSPDDPASNYRMARDRLLDRVPVPALQVHRMRGEDEPAQAAAAYEQVLRMAFGTPAGPPRTTPGARFDLLLLGLGHDGHTASLFPGTPALRECERWVVGHRVPLAPSGRVTITARVIQAAAEVLFLVAGAPKASILHRVLEGPYEPEALPAQTIAPRAGRLRWLVDADAAAELRG